MKIQFTSICAAPAYVTHRHLTAREKDAVIRRMLASLISLSLKVQKDGNRAWIVRTMQRVAKGGEE